jgi:anaphase-promoting complex subunit 2
MTFISKGFWPINQALEFYKIPKKIKILLETYGQAFSQIKAMRKIDLHHNLGIVKLSLSFENGDFIFKCQPIHALLILLF